MWKTLQVKTCLAYHIAYCKSIKSFYTFIQQAIKREHLQKSAFIYFYFNFWQLLVIIFIQSLLKECNKKQ